MRWFVEERNESMEVRRTLVWAFDSVKFAQPRSTLFKIFGLLVRINSFTYFAPSCHV